MTPECGREAVLVVLAGGKPCALCERLMLPPVVSTKAARKGRGPASLKRIVCGLCRSRAGSRLRTREALAARALDIGLAALG